MLNYRTDAGTEGGVEVTVPKPRKLKPLDADGKRSPSPEEPSTPSNKTSNVADELKVPLTPMPPVGPKPADSPAHPARKVKSARLDDEAEVQHLSHPKPSPAETSEDEDEEDPEQEALMQAIEKRLSQASSSAKQSRMEQRKSLAVRVAPPSRQYTDHLYRQAEQLLLWKKLERNVDEDDEKSSSRARAKNLKLHGQGSIEGQTLQTMGTKVWTKFDEDDVTIAAVADDDEDNEKRNSEEPGTGGSADDESQIQPGTLPAPGEAPEGQTKPKVEVKPKVQRGPHPLKDYLTAKKIKLDDVKTTLETLRGKGELEHWLEAPLEISGTPPKPLVVAVAESNPALVELLVGTFNADVTIPFEGASMYKGWVKPGATLIDSVVNRKGRFVGTMLANKLEQIEQIFKDAAVRQEEEKAKKLADEALVSSGSRIVSQEKGRSSLLFQIELAEGVVRHTQGHPKDVYEIMEHLGDGDTSTVWGGWHSHSKLSVAIKTEAKSDEAGIWDEIAMMRKMKHPNVAQLYETFENETQVFMVLELCEGGRLSDSVGPDATLQRSLSRNPNLLRQMADAVKYIHSRSICHRDIQLDNFLIFESAEVINKANVKLIDFTTAKEYGNGQELVTKVCTPTYVAREILTRRMEVYTEKVDIWSLGVTFFIIMSGATPFPGDTDFEILKKVKKATWKFEPEKDWKDVSEQAKDLVSNMIKFRPEERLSAAEVLDHPYLSSSQ